MNAMAPASGLKTAGQWAMAEPFEECRRALHVRPFRLTHSLASDPLFSISALVKAAQMAAKRSGDAYVDAGNVSISDKWGKIPTPDLPVDEVIKRIETAGAWIILKHVEKDLRYGAILEEFASLVLDIAGPEEAKLLLNPEMLVILTSPKRLTSYHFDAEVNFLVQVRGQKQVWICDPNDREITTEDEIYRYYTETNTAGTFKPVAQERAQHFLLNPGEAVHIPSHAAHWVQNGDDISVSLSLNFEFPSWKYRDVYAANRILRLIGLNPSPPGQTYWENAPKVAFVKAARRVKRIAKRRGSLVGRKTEPNREVAV